MSGLTLDTKNMGTDPAGLTFILRGISFISSAYETGTEPHLEGSTFDPDSEGCSAYNCFGNNQHTLLKIHHNGRTFDIMTWNVSNSFQNPQCAYTEIEFATGKTHNGQSIVDFFSDGATFDLIYGIQSADQPDLSGSLDSSKGFDPLFPTFKIQNAGIILVDDSPKLTRDKTPEYIGMLNLTTPEEEERTTLSISTNPNTKANSVLGITYTINSEVQKNIIGMSQNDSVFFQGGTQAENNLTNKLGLSGATSITGKTLTVTNNDGETAEIGLKFVPDITVGAEGITFFNAVTGVNHGNTSGFTFTIQCTEPKLYAETIKKVSIKYPGAQAFTPIEVRPLGDSFDKLQGFLPGYTGSVPSGGTGISLKLNNLLQSNVPPGVTINASNFNTTITKSNAFEYHPAIEIHSMGAVGATYYIEVPGATTTITGINLGPTSGIQFSITKQTSILPQLDSSTPPGGMTLIIAHPLEGNQIGHTMNAEIRVTMGNRSANITTAVLAKPGFSLDPEQRFIQGNTGTQPKGFSGSNFITSNFIGITQFASARIGGTACIIDYENTQNTLLQITVPGLGPTWGNGFLTYTHPAGTTQASIHIYLQPSGSTISPSGFTQGVTSTATITGNSLLSVNKVFFENSSQSQFKFNVTHNVLSNTQIGITVENDIPSGTYRIKAETLSERPGPWELFDQISVITPPPPAPTIPLAYQLFGNTGLTQHGFTWTIGQNIIANWFTTQWSTTGDYRMGYDITNSLTLDSNRFTQRLAHASHYLEHVNDVKLPYKIRHEATGITMVLVLPDGFTMGATGSPWGPVSLWGATMSRPKEQVYVSLTNPYYISESVLTEKMIQGTAGHTYNPYIIDSQTKFDEANKKFNQIGMRLPVEAEWEFAARSVYIGSTLDNTQYHSSKRYRSGTDISNGYSFDKITWSAPNITGLFDTIGLVKELMGNTGYSYGTGFDVNPRIPSGQETESAGYLIKGSSGSIASHLAGASKDLVTRGYLFFGNTAGNTMDGITNATPSSIPDKQDIWSVARRDIVFGLTGNTGDGVIWPGPVRTGVGLRALKPIHLGNITPIGDCCFNNICYSAEQSACLAVGGITGCSGCTCNPSTGQCGVLCCAYGNLTCEPNCAACISKPPPLTNIWWSGFNLNGITVANVNSQFQRFYNRFDFTGITSGAGITLVSETTFMNSIVGLTHGIIVSGLTGNATSINTLNRDQFIIGSRKKSQLDAAFTEIFARGGPNGTTHVMRLPAGFTIGVEGNPVSSGWVTGTTYHKATVGKTCESYVWNDVLQPKHCSTGFIGFRLIYNDLLEGVEKIYYGWIGFEIKPDAIGSSNRLLYITDWAYNKSFNEEIHTGQGRIYPPQCGSACTQLGPRGSCNPIGCDPDNPDCNLCCECRTRDDFVIRSCEPCSVPDSNCPSCTPSIRSGSTCLSSGDL